MRGLVAHPFLLAAYPVLFLFAQNLNEGVTFSTVVGPLLFVLACTALLFALLWLLLRNPHKAGLLTSILVILFFSFGRVEDALGKRAGPVDLLLWLWVALAVAGAVLVARSGSRSPKMTGVLNVVALVLVALNVVPVVRESFNPPPPVPAVPGLKLPLGEAPEKVQKRDIYYIIFDRYGNERTLKRRYGFDNSAFLDFLGDQGFYVAHDSFANHLKTAESLASSLNMTYLNYLTEEYGTDSDDFYPIFRLLENHKVAGYLKSIGYRYHHVGSGYNFTADSPLADVTYTYGALSEFSTVLLETTLWGRLGERFGWDEELAFTASPGGRITFQMEKLMEVENDEAPTFTFAHFILPHPPYVFDRDGNVLPRVLDSSKVADERYIDQLIYTNKVIKEIVLDLLEGPDASDPIIVIQSDEGPHPKQLYGSERGYRWPQAPTAELRQKLLILNAYYLPGADHDQLYRSISPVNTFRLIFNLYFSADLPLLEDRSWVFQDADHLYKFSDVTERVRVDRSGRTTGRTRR